MRGRKRGIDGNRVGDLRKARAMSKAQLCREAGIAAQTLDRMERGEATREDRQRAVAKALGEPFEKVFPNEKQ